MTHGFVEPLSRCAKIGGDANLFAYASGTYIFKLTAIWSPKRTHQPTQGHQLYQMMYILTSAETCIRTTVAWRYGYSPQAITRAGYGTSRVARRQCQAST